MLFARRLESWGNKEIYSIKSWFLLKAMILLAGAFAFNKEQKVSD
jgi:hypothetical protein